MYGLIVGMIGLLTTATVESASTSQPTTAPSTQPARAADPRVDALLDRLEAKGQDVDDLTARLTWQLYDELIDEQQIRHGELLYRRENHGGRFLVRFDDTVTDGRINKSREWIGFADGWSTEKKESTKSIIKRQWTRPGEDVDLFTLGKGPFPMPFGQRKADILRYLRVSLMPSKPADPPDTDHLMLIPRKGSDLAERYKRLDFYVGRQLGLPVRIAFVDAQDVVITFDFDNITLNTNLPDSRFHVSEPRDYQVDIEPLPAEPE